MLAGAVVAPGVAAFDLNEDSGKTGEWTINDDGFSPGAVCRYENNPGKKKDETNKVSSKKVWTHGPFAQKSWVGHRIVVQKRKNGAAGWTRAWKSGWNKQKANDTQVAFFKGVNFKTPEKHGKQYRVLHQFDYYKKGSQTTVVGRVRGSIEVYKHILAEQAPYLFGTEGGPAGRCAKTWWLPL
jgi:hypothetical protein